MYVTQVFKHQPLLISQPWQQQCGIYFLISLYPLTSRSILAILIAHKQKVYNDKMLISGWTIILKGSSDAKIHLFEHMCVGSVCTRGVVLGMTSDFQIFTSESRSWLVADDVLNEQNIAASSDGGPKPSANATPVATGKLCPAGTCITVTL